MDVSISTGSMWLHSGIQNHSMWDRLLVLATCGWGYRQAISTVKLHWVGAIGRL